MAKASGKYAQAISDRSGFAFPYREMLKEWNGSLVHKSEFEAVLKTSPEEVQKKLDKALGRTKISEAE